LARNIGIDARKVTDFGIGTYINNLVRSLAEIDQENEYVLFVGKPGLEVLADLPDNFRLIVENSPVYSVRELVALSWKLFRLRLDLYHATHYVLPAVVPCRVVVTIHDIIHLLYPEFLPNRMAFLYAKRMIHRSLRRGDRILTDSQNTKSDLMDYFETDGRKIEVVYPGVAETYRRQLDQEQIQHVLADHHLKRPYLLFVGNPKPHKNLDNVLRAFAEVIKRDAFGGELVCVGGSDDGEQRIVREAERLGVAARVRLLGHVAEAALPAIYQGAQLFLYPTLYEGFGLPVVEAMASGVPVITSNTSSLFEIAEGYASLVDPLNVEQLADAIGTALTDEALRQQLIAAGRNRANQFSWKQTAEETLRVYQAAMHGDPPAGVAT
jgi:glycosyltransferase involved in cell wall biosynthesis